ncbi:unnamed protein product, partial [marine sediment metagenome]
MSEKTKKVRVTIPGVNLNKIFGPRDDEMSESTTETKGKLEKRREDLAKLELEEEILDVENRITRRRDGKPVEVAPKDSLGDTMVREVIIPLVNRKLADDDRPRGSDSTVDRALRIAEKAVGRGQPKPGDGETSAMDELEKGIGIFTKIKDLIEVEKTEKEEAGEPVKKEADSLAELDRGLDLVQKLRETFPSEGGGGMSDAMMEFKKWEKTFELDVRKADREE